MTMNISNKNCSNIFQRQKLPPIYGVEMCVALAGNILALWLLVTKERKNWHTGVVFSCNLIVSDIFYALTLPLFIDYYSRGRVWIFGDATCKIERFLFNCNLYVSIYFIMCISVNRYLAIVHPVFTRNHIRPKHAKIISVLVWIFVASISSPVLYYSGLKSHDTTVEDDDDEKFTCSLFPNQKTKHVNYRVFMAVVGCLVPFIITFSSYIGVLVAVLKNARITSLQKRKVSLIITLGCVSYAVSFIPYHILQIWTFKLREENQRDCDVHKGFQVSKALACMNMCLHPILYMAVFDSITAVCWRKLAGVATVQLTVREQNSKDTVLASTD